MAQRVPRVARDDTTRLEPKAGPTLTLPIGLYDPRHEHDACGVGFVVNIKGTPSHQVVSHGLEILRSLAHRGGRGADPNTGDGTGILVQVPHRFFQEVCPALGIALPPAGEYGVGFAFLAADNADGTEEARRLVERVVKEEGQELLGWRDVPTDLSEVGESARSVAPHIAQVFIGRGAGLTDQQHFERKLYVIRKRIENAPAYPPTRPPVYFASLSSRTVIYKGMLTANQIGGVFADLRNPAFESALALVHERFSTNTFPSWPLAHPYRYVAHNGEINTLRGNLNWMSARSALCRSTLLGPDLEKVMPVLREGQSDTASFDNVLEFLVMAGRSLPHAMLMMIPEAWTGHATMSAERKAFYEYHSALMEPWDGPASIAFTDGRVIGAMLDRNGLRPSRYYVTDTDLVIMGSEVGVLDVPAERIVKKGRLQPGRMFLVDTVQGRIVGDDEIKDELARAHQYGEWLRENRLVLEDLPTPGASPGVPTSVTPGLRQGLATLRQFGYTLEDLKVVMGPMATNGEEPLGSMGTDSALAVLSDRPRLLFDYFKQLFAQVTNPPLDAIREELVTSMDSWIGPEHNLLEPTAASCRRIRLKYPVLSGDDFWRVAVTSVPGLSTIRLTTTYPVAVGTAGLEQALNDLNRRAARAVAAGIGIVVLTDRGSDDTTAPIPSLLATASVHHHLLREGLRARCGLIVESGDAREVHHVALLLGYGANAVTPWLAIETLGEMIRAGDLTGLNHATAVKHYVKAMNKGVLKVMSKMGISTLQGYCGAQIFEAVGLDAGFIAKYFTGTASRIGGIGLETVSEEIRARCDATRAPRPAHRAPLPSGGEYQWRRDGEYHLFNPETVFKLQHATRSGQASVFREYTRAVDEQDRRRATLRGLMTLRLAPEPVALDEVESVESIIRRFATGAMSYGSISSEAHETLAIAMNRMGAKSNTGEGGEDPKRYQRDANGDSRRSAVKQVASGRFGVTSEYLVQADDLQIKMAQGAKPGEGGQLPGHKVYPWIAEVRLSTPGVGLISPPPHHDIYCIEDLAQLIHDLKNANPRARIHVKLVAEAGVGTVAAGVAKAKADVVLISGHDGGTGASPLTSIKHGGVPWELGLAEAQQVLMLNGLRDRIVVQVDGQMKTGRDVIVAAMLGAEEFGFSTAPLVVMGCVMMRVCHLNTCPVGIATQDPELRKRFAGKPEFVQNFFQFIAEEVREYLAKLGLRSMDELIGRVDLLDFAPALDHWKARGLDYSAILHQPAVDPAASRRATTLQEHALAASLDESTIIPATRRAVEFKTPVELELPIRNVHRTVGTRLGYEVTSRWGAAGLPEDTIRLRFNGSAGQSFGAFVPRGITMLLKGDANDYFGKGLSGGILAVFPPREVSFVPEENIIIGNVALYGATSGEAFVRGIAGERFAVRNSGATAVVEGVGDHGCEYMTGGRVVVLGPTGRNFAAGMSGGIAYVLDLAGDFAATRCNRELVDLESLDDPEEVLFLRHLVRRHVSATGSLYARRLLATWKRVQSRFVKVMPRDYKRAIERAAGQVRVTDTGALAGTSANG